ARSEDFQNIVRNAAQLALAAGGDVAALAAAPYPGENHSLKDELTEAIAKIGENMTLRRTAVIEVPEGVVGTYVHSAVVEGLGRIGVLVGLESTGDKAKLEALGRQIAMHVAAVKPLSLSEAELDPEVIERERAVFVEQAKASGKPDAIVEKMVEGRVRKYYEEVTLLAQTFVIDGENSVAQAVKNAEKDVGAPIKVTGFVLFVLGEGIEKQETDFAA